MTAERLGTKQPCPLVSKKAGVGSPGLISPPALSISALQLLSWQRGLPALGSSHLCNPRQGSITPDLPLQLRALSKASFSSHNLIPVLSSGPVVPYQLGLVCRGPVQQTGRAVSAGAPGASPHSVERRGRADLVSSHISMLRAESGKFSSLSKTNFTGLKEEKLLGGA